MNTILLKCSLTNVLLSIDRRRDSRDSNASGPRDGSTSRKSISQRDKSNKQAKLSGVAGKFVRHTNSLSASVIMLIIYYD